MMERKRERFYRVVEIVLDSGCLEYRIYDAKNRSKNTMTESQIEKLYTREGCCVCNCSGYGRSNVR
jgi:hypothetical protein